MHLGIADFMLGKKTPLDNGITRMDIHPLKNPKEWFRIDEHYPAMIKKKRQLTRLYPQVVYQVLEEAKEGALELAFKMIEHLPWAYPEYFERNGCQLINHLTQEVLDLDQLSLNPLLFVSMLVQEDLILLHQRDDGRYYLSGGHLCFPSDWSLTEKLGRNLSFIHQPVPLLNKNIGANIELFLAKMKSFQQFWRINFLTTGSGKWGHLKDVKSENEYDFGQKVTHQNVEQLYLRNEREIFTKLPQTGDILFGLKIYITPFRDLSGSYAHKLADMIEGLPHQVVSQYRNWEEDEWRVVVNYLREK